MRGSSTLGPQRRTTPRRVTPRAPRGAQNSPCRTFCWNTPDVADADGWGLGLGLVVLGRAVVGFGRWDVGRVVGVLLVGEELAIGVGDAVVEGAWGAGSKCARST